MTHPIGDDAGERQPDTITRAAGTLRGLILFGHGARDPRWAEPFERLAAVVSARFRADRIHDKDSPATQGRTALSADSHPQHLAATARPGPVTLAYLELMTPDLATAINDQVRAGCGVITVVPVFFGQGAHLRRDFPALLDACRRTHPGVDIRTTAAVGEVDSVIAAIGDYVVGEW